MGEQGRALGVSFTHVGEFDEWRVFVYSDRKFVYKGSYGIFDVSGFVVLCAFVGLTEDGKDSLEALELLSRALKQVRSQEIIGIKIAFFFFHFFLSIATSCEAVG